MDVTEPSTGARPEQKQGPSTRSYFASHGFIGLAIAMTMAGGILRYAAAHGDLWLDEILTLRSLTSITSPWQIFYKINNDNNHLLNTLYIYLLGSDRNPVHLRMLAVICGTLAIPAAGLVAAGPRKDMMRGGVAMTVFAMSSPMAYYSSEARGYAGLELFTLLSLVAAVGPSSARHKRWCLGACAALGVLSHPFMVPFVGGQALSEIIFRLQNKVRARDSILQVFSLFRYSFLACLIYVFYFISIYETLGYAEIFTTNTGFPEFTLGYTRMMSFCFGFIYYGNKTIDAMVFLISLIIFTVILIKNTDRFEKILCMTFVVTIPLSLAVFRPDNMYNARYFFFCWTPMLLAMSTTISTSIARKDYRRYAAFIALTAFMTLNLHDCLNLINIGRGDYSGMAKVLAGMEHRTYSANFGDNQTIVLNYYAALQHTRLTSVPVADWCQTVPDGLVLARVAFPDHLIYGPGGCQGEFERIGTYDAWGYEVFPLAIYRHVSGFSRSG